MKKECWKVHFVATCEDCGKEFQEFINGQALAAKHAKKYKHIVRGEVGLAVVYNGKED